MTEAGKGLVGVLGARGRWSTEGVGGGADLMTRCGMRERDGRAGQEVGPQDAEAWVR